MDMTEYSGFGDLYLHLRKAPDYLICPKEKYNPPLLPIKMADYSSITENLPEFGHPCRQLFFVSEEFIFLNHGALGCTLKDSLLVSQDYERYMDSQPIRARDREILPLLCYVIREMAEFIGCEPRDLVLVENATQGIGIILKSLKFTPDDTILTLDLGYGAVGFAVDDVCKASGAKHLKVEIDLPISDETQILEKVESALVDGVKLAVFDHIPSNAAFLMPIEKLCEMCRKRGILVLVDGAHGLGQVDLNISSLNTDFYVTNCHKWFANTRGSALMYIRRQHQDDLKSLVVSWGYNYGFIRRFIWSGTQYYSSYVSLLNTLNFWKAVGACEIRKHCYSTILKAEELCRMAWNVEPVCPKQLWRCMALVRLPDRLNDPKWNPDGLKRNIIQDYLYFNHSIEAAIRDVNGILYVRLCCHIYNELSDFQKLSDAVLKANDDRDDIANLCKQFIPLGV